MPSVHLFLNSFIAKHVAIKIKINRLSHTCNLSDNKINESVQRCNHGRYFLDILCLSLFTFKYMFFDLYFAYWLKTQKPQAESWFTLIWSSSTISLSAGSMSGADDDDSRDSRMSLMARRALYVAKSFVISGLVPIDVGDHTSGSDRSRTCHSDVSSKNKLCFVGPHPSPPGPQEM